MVYMLVVADENSIVQIKSRNRTFIGFHIRTTASLRFNKILLSLYECEPVIPRSIRLIYRITKGRPEF